MQTLLQDRRHMYQTLVQHGIPTAAHIIIDRDGLEPGQDPEGFVEDEDFVEMHGQRIFKVTAVLDWSHCYFNETSSRSVIKSHMPFFIVLT